TPRASNARARVTLAATSSEKPGACSPSRRVVSKTTMRSGPWAIPQVVAARRFRSQSDNYYDMISHYYGPAGPQDLPGRGPRAQLFARRGQGAPHAARREPGGAAAGSGLGRGAVRSLVEERHADRRRTPPPELRPSAGW